VILLDTNVISALMQRDVDHAVVEWLDSQPSDRSFEGRIVPFDEAAAQSAEQIAAGAKSSHRDAQRASL
jgi:predicted nucleic acid-binding protein